MSKWTTYLVEDYLGIKDHDPKLYGYNFSKKTHNLRFYKSKFSSKIYVDFMSGDIERIKTATTKIMTVNVFFIETPMNSMLKRKLK